VIPLIIISKRTVLISEYLIINSYNSYLILQNNNNGLKLIKYVYASTKEQNLLEFIHIHNIGGRMKLILIHF
jgi:hypothetical protein